MLVLDLRDRSLGNAEADLRGNELLDPIEETIARLGLGEPLPVASAADIVPESLGGPLRGGRPLPDVSGQIIEPVEGLVLPHIGDVGSVEIRILRGIGSLRPGIAGPSPSSHRGLVLPLGRQRVDSVLIAILQP